MPTALFKKRRFWLLIIPLALVVIAAVVLAIAIPRALSTYSLFENVPTSKLPQFASNADAVPGWQKSADTFGVSTSGLSSEVYVQKGGSCALSTTTTFLPAFQKGHGDEYVTKLALYQNGLQENAAIHDSSPLYITSKDGKQVQFATGYFTFSQNKVQYKTFVAVRAIDKLYTNPVTAPAAGNTKDILGISTSLGLPVLTATYTCKQKVASEQGFQKLATATHIVLN